MTSHDKKHKIDNTDNHDSVTLSELSTVVSDDSVAGVDATQTLANKEVPDLQLSLTGPARSPAEGMIYWDDVAKTPAAKLEGTDPVLQIGQEMHVRCTNKTGVDIPDGSAVYINGVQGNRPTIALARADAEATACVVGLTTQLIADNLTGYVTIHGLVRGIKTDYGGWVEGDTIYLDESTAGDMRNSAPAFPNYCQKVGTLLLAHSSGGIIYVDTGIEPPNHSMFNNVGIKSLKAGDIGGGNYIEIEADGSLVAKGDATMFDDLVGSLIGRQLSSAAGKVDYNWSENSITMQSGGSITTINDLLIFNYQYPHACIITGCMCLHIHWEQVNTNKIEWTIDYRIQSNNAVKTTSWTRLTANSDDDSVFTYPGSGTFNQIVELGHIDMTGAGISATVQFRIARTDVTGGNIEATFVDAHVERDALGSRTEYTK